MIEYYPKSIYYPLEEVGKKYALGELKQLEYYLHSFVERHLYEIMNNIDADKQDNITDEDIIDAIKTEILIRGSIQPAAELADVIKEINKEVWYRHEKITERTSVDEIAEDWQALYAVKWHEARIFETFFVINHCKETLLAMFYGMRCI